MSTEDTPKPVGLPDPDTHCWDDDIHRDVWSYSQALMRATIDAAVAAERERCAKLCESIHERHVAEYGNYIGETYAAECARAIRA